MRAVFALLTAATVAIASLAAQPAPSGGAAIYEKLVRSTVWIVSKHGSNTFTGSGSLIDRRRMLVLTNYHVVGDSDQAKIVFPIFRDNKIVAERDVYRQRVNSEGISARVL